MRRYLTVVWNDITSPFRDWSMRGVGAFLVVMVVVAAIGAAVGAALGGPWYVLLRFVLGYPHERAMELTAAWMVVTMFVLGYAVSVIDRAKR